MTTHLVIADRETLDRFVDNAEDLAYIGDSWDDLYHLETGDTWLICVPAAAQLDPGSVTFAYTDGNCANPDALASMLGGDRDNPWYSRHLPLAAACDLLGVDEL